MAVIEDPRRPAPPRPLGQSALCLGVVLAGLVVVAMLVNLAASMIF